MNELQSKNQKIIDMVIERAKRDFPDDIALIGLTGSFNTNDFHRYSDLDLIIVNNTAKGWEIGDGFIYDDVGYDIYCTPWSRLEQMAEFKNVGTSTLTRMQILYVAKPEYLDRFNAIRQKALDEMDKPIGADCINMAGEHIMGAKQEYADMMLSDDENTVRFAAFGMMYYLLNAIIRLNNTCIQRGTKRYLEELLACKYLPNNFESLYMAVIDAKTTAETKSAAGKYLSAVIELRDDMRKQFVPSPVPTYENLNGTYEEAWCNLYNKVRASVAANDKSYAFFVAGDSQNYFDEMTNDRGTKKFDLMKHFDSDNLSVFHNAFMQAMDEYKAEYKKVGRKVRKFECIDELVNDFLE